MISGRRTYVDILAQPFIMHNPMAMEPADIIFGI
jgi:hypothetical protein